jgi:endonuclease/exonuclease/phosphatase (EEP) superfamily protein YafD
VPIRYADLVLSLLRTAVVTPVFLAGLSLLLILLAVRLTPLPGLTDWWPIEALDTFALYAFAPFLGVGLAALLLWSRALAVVFVVALLFFAQQFGTPIVRAAGLFTPPAAAAGEGRPRLRVLTLNVYSLNRDPTPFLPLIERVQPDVILLQEVTDEFVRPFTRMIGKEYPFSTTTGTDTDHFGVATWSRYPLLEPVLLRPIEYGNMMHRVKLSTGQGDVWLYNVHLQNPTASTQNGGRLARTRRFDSWDRDYEIGWLIEQTRQHDLPFVLAGDFNSSAGSYPYRRFPASWRDAMATVGRGFGHTYPSPSHEIQAGGRLPIWFPLIRIDYVMTSLQIQPIRTWTEEHPRTDHLAVVADLELP